MRKRASILLLILMIPVSIFATSVDFSFDVPKSIEGELKIGVRDALSQILPSYIVIDNDKTDSMHIDVVVVDYNEEENTLIVDFSTSYNNKKLDFTVEVLKAENEDNLFQMLEKKTYDAYKYDIDSLFEDDGSLSIDYTTSQLTSYEFDEDDVPLNSQYFYIKDESGDSVGLCNINSIFDHTATLNILYNEGLSPKLSLVEGPTGMLSSQASFDFMGKSIYSSLSYTYFKSIIPFLKNANMMFEFGGAYNIKYQMTAGYFDAGLSIDLPLSLIFNSDSLLRNTGIRATALGGVGYKDEFGFHAKYTVGYYVYLNERYNLEAYYEANTMFTSFVDSSIILGIKASVLF